MPITTHSAELRRRRLVAGLTIKDLAERIGYSAGHVNRIELGMMNGGPRFHVAAAEALDCRVQDITGDVVPVSKRRAG